MIARYAPELPVRPTAGSGASRDASGTAGNRAVMALGMLCVPLIAFGFVLGMFLITIG